jgi:hypothetical protein
MLKLTLHFNNQHLNLHLYLYFCSNKNVTLVHAFMSSRAFTYLTRFICLSGVLLINTICRGQIELSSGIDMSYPQLINSNNTLVNYGQISFGLRFGVAYKPQNTQFFPLLTFAFGRTRLPLKQFNKNVAALNFNYVNVMINENYIIRFPTSQLFIYGGIGFSYLMDKGVTVAGAGGGTMQATIDSTENVSKAFPAMNLGFEYVYGASTDKDLYLGMGINFQYILLLAERNTYHVTVDEPNYHFQNLDASLTGNVVSPGFYIALHYIMHPSKKKSHMYL